MMKIPGVFRISLLLGIALVLALIIVPRLITFNHNVRLVASSNLNLTQYVNPFIGTAPGGSSFGFGGDSGDTFPGATYPMGMVQWSPDTPSRLPGGYYYPDYTITGFSLTHFSGRGCRVYQDIPFLPMVGPVTASPATSGPTYWSHFSHSTESAHPGYYRVQLADPHVTVTPGSSSSTGSQSGAFATFDTTFNRVVQVKVGISFVSRANAEANVTSENPGW